MTNDRQPNQHALDNHPFYFIVNFWGEEYRWMFLNLCLASLLSPGNIPSLVNKANSRFLILAPRADLNAIEGTQLMELLRNHIQPELIEIPSPDETKNKFDLNTHSAKRGAEIAFANKACGVFLCPDALLSDGAVISLQERARKGAKAVLATALRHDQSRFLAELRDSSAVELGKPLCLAPRELMKLGLDNLHPQVGLHDWDGKTFNAYPGFCVWHVLGGNGLILHTMRWAPLLINYGNLQTHVTWSKFGGADHVSFDDDYIYNNFGSSNDVQAITDTDELAWVSLTPADTALTNDTTSSIFSKRICLRVNAQTGTMDPLQWRLFRHHIRMHSDAITEIWEDREREIDQILDSCLARSPSRFDKLWQRFGARGLRKLARAGLARLFRLPGTAKRLRNRVQAT
jgi:hypothetical protein